jgi:DNA-binding response OmpR family regulator
LVVEDESIVVRMITMALSMAGFRASVAENGDKGYDQFLAHRDEICMVLADVMMPVRNGLEMADRIRGLAPDLPILLLTGYSDHALVSEAQTRYTVIRKPFLPTDLIARVQAALDKASQKGAGS